VKREVSAETRERSVRAKQRNVAEPLNRSDGNREAALGGIGGVCGACVAGVAHHGQFANSVCGRTHKLSRFHHGSSWILCCPDGVALEGAKDPWRERAGRGRNLSGSNSVVESQPSKLLVAGSIPVSRSRFEAFRWCGNRNKEARTSVKGKAAKQRSVAEPWNEKGERGVSAV
jgi:hypothetical protein